MTTHFLKTWPPFFARVRNGSKRYELRKDDRGYAVGDHLILLEFDPQTALMLVDAGSYVLTLPEAP